MQESVAQQPKAVLVNFTGVPYISSSGIGVLMYAYSELSQRNAKLVFVNMQDAVHKTLKLVALVDLALVAKTEDEGVKLALSDAPLP